jgi:hypothetical protein
MVEKKGKNDLLYLFLIIAPRAPVSTGTKPAKSKPRHRFCICCRDGDGMSNTALKVLMLERLAEMRRRVRQAAVRVRHNVTCALNWREQGDEASCQEQLSTVRLLDDWEPDEQVNAQ